MQLLLKCRRLFWPLWLAVLMSGCIAPRESIVVQEPIGPTPVLERATRKPQGHLVVFSEQETKSVGDSDYTVHSNYKIYSEGKLLMSVPNQEGNFGEEPSAVGLPAGFYTVVANAAKFRSVTVPVVIDDFKTTRLYLDGSGARLKKSGEEGDFVRLPDGSIVGWRAKQDEKKN